LIKMLSPCPTSIKVISPYGDNIFPNKWTHMIVSGRNKTCKNFFTPFIRSHNEKNKGMLHKYKSKKNMEGRPKVSMANGISESRNARSSIPIMSKFNG